MASSSKGLQLIWQDERQSRTSNQPPLIQMRCAIPSAGGSTLRVSEGEGEGEGEGGRVVRLGPRHLLEAHAGRSGAGVVFLWGLWFLGHVLRRTVCLP